MVFQRFRAVAAQFGPQIEKFSASSAVSRVLPVAVLQKLDLQVRRMPLACRGPFSLCLHQAVSLKPAGAAFTSVSAASERTLSDR